MTECADCDEEILLDDGCEHTEPPLCHGCEKDRLSAELSALRARVAELTEERDAARRDLEAATEELSRVRDYAAMFLRAYEEYVTQHGVEHEDECPEDDTCECDLISKLNVTHAALRAIDGIT